MSMSNTNKTVRLTSKEMDMCIKEIASGDNDALKKLYEEFRIPVYKFAMSIVKNCNSAEDIASETFLRIKANAANYQARGKACSWIFSIVRNLSISELRSQKGIVSFDDRTVVIDEKDDFNAILEQSSSKLLDFLNEDEREIVSLHVLGGLKHYEIAEVLKLPYSQVRWKYAYAIKKLSKAFSKHLTNIRVKEGTINEQ